MKKLLFGLIAGLSAGILFAPKPGKKLREQLKNSDAKFADFGNALLDAAKDAGGEVQEVFDSEEMQKMLTSGKKSVDEFVSLLEEKGGDLSKKAQAELEDLLDNAVVNAEKVKKTAKKKVSTAKKAAEKTVKTVKKDVKKKTAAAKKVATKKVAEAKKTAQKTIAKAAKKAEKKMKK